MANNMVQGPVKLDGEGLKHRPAGYWESGEYAENVNVDLSTNGTLQNRPPVTGYGQFDYGGGTLPYSRYFNHFIGSHQESPFVSGYKTRGIGYLNSLGQIKHTLPSAHTAAQNVFFSIRNFSGTGYLGSEVTPYGLYVYNGTLYVIMHGGYRPQGDPSPSINDNLVSYITVLSEQISESDPSPSQVLDAYSTLNANGSMLHQKVHSNYYLSGVATAAYYANRSEYPELPVSSHTLYKDRLWIASEDTIYFSNIAALDDFSNPSGINFIRIPNEKITSIVGTQDTLYVVTENRIYALSYNDVPTDGELTLISSETGGDSATVWNDSVYVVNNDSIFVINGYNVSLFLNLELKFDFTSFPLEFNSSYSISFFRGAKHQLKIESFNGSLYIVSRYLRVLWKDFTDKYSSLYPWALEFDYYYYGNLDSSFPDEYPSPYPTSSSSPDLIKVDIDIGFVSTYSFGSNGKVIDLIQILGYNNYADSKLFFTGSLNFHSLNTLFSLVPRTIHEDNPYFVDLYINNYEVNSMVLATSIRYEVPGIRVLFKNHSPDNLRYAIKKVRSLIIEGKSSHPLLHSVFVNHLRLKFLSEGAIFLSESWENNVQRLGVNQRGRSFDIQIISNGYTFGSTTRAEGEPVPCNGFIMGSDAFFEIRDLRYLWTYTQRLRTV